MVILDSEDCRALYRHERFRQAAPSQPGDGACHAERFAASAALHVMAVDKGLGGG
jgi:hypothetical protein